MKSINKKYYVLKNILHLILLLILMPYSKNIPNYMINEVYNIINLYTNLYLDINDNKIVLSPKKKSYFRIIFIKNNSYFIESIRNYKLGINSLGKIILNKIVDETDLQFQWNIINIKKNYIKIQNKYNLEFLEVKDKSLKLTENHIFNRDNLLMNNKKIFIINKLFEEFRYKTSKKVVREPIDIIIKYIDLNDKALNRKGFIHSYKDVDNEELRYSLKSILQYIPWVRKIYILMPNEFVRYLKPIDEINDKILYIKDKDLIGFESANIQTFLFNLFKTEQFGISKNFIYMEDDYFIGTKLSKNELFYYDEKEKKVVPYIISYLFYNLNKTFLFNYYYDLFKRNRLINPHSKEGFRHQTSNTEKFLLENYNASLIKVQFTHNAIPENIDDLKEIYNESNKYEFKNETFFFKYRHILSLCHQHFLNIYNLNIKKRKVNLIYTRYIPIEKLKKNKLSQKLFVINTGGNHIPLNRQYKIQKKTMNIRFNFNIIYDIKDKKKYKLNFIICPFYHILKLYIFFIIIKMNSFLF